MFNFKNLENKRFGRLVVSKRVANKGKRVIWLCRCDCGKEKEVYSCNLTRGYTKSCGCLHRSIVFKGYEGISLTYWKSLKRNATIRGVGFLLTLRQAWEKFTKQGGKCAFTGLPLKFGKGSKQTASIDRIDNKKPYEVSNIQWIHKKINKIKGTFSDDELICVAHHIANHKELNEGELKWLTERFLQTETK